MPSSVSTSVKLMLSKGVSKVSTSTAPGTSSGVINSPLPKKVVTSPNPATGGLPTAPMVLVLLNASCEISTLPEFENSRSPS